MNPRNSNSRVVFYSLFVLIFSTILQVQAADMGQLVMESMEENDVTKQDFQKQVETFENGSPFIQNNSESLDLSGISLEDTAFLPVDLDPKKQEQVEVKSKRRDLGQTVPDVLAQGDELKTYTYDEIYGEERNKTSQSANFVYYKNSFDYSDPSGVFNRTYDNANNSKSIKAGLIMVHVERNIWSSLIKVNWVGGLGVSYNQGLGTFSNGAQSKTVFKLWEVPLDLGLSAEIPLTSLFAVNVAGGPSILGLLQNRSDKEHSEAEKTRRQYSLGYFGRLQGKIYLERIFPKSLFSLYRDFGVSRSALTIEARTHQYSSFKESNREISGVSLGVGLNFEYL